MNKRIVICLDGTNNRYDATNTNVIKLYGMLDRRATDMLAYYQPGIGTMAPVGIWGKLQRWFIKGLTSLSRGCSKTTLPVPIGF